MSSPAVEADSPTTDTDKPDAQPSGLVRGLLRVEDWIVRMGDYINPILVKETRQAIKSKQFTFVFLLLLVCCWVITIGGVAMIGPGIYYLASGGIMLTWFYYVLLFPLLVVVPFGAFRSLLSEREDNTYDLLRVSTLMPKQIIRGKLCSAIAQMGIYLSALAPCLAFTYLLRGVDISMIVLLLTYAVLACVGLSMVGLFFAASAQQKQGQVILSVGFVTVLLGCFFGGLGITTEFLQEGSMWINSAPFWTINAMVFSIYATTFLLIYLAAVAQISFHSDNRSTALRWAMMLQYITYIGWVAFAFCRYFDVWATVVGRRPVEDEALFSMAIGGIVYWFFMGTFLTGESADLSHRVQRALPQSIAGRFFLGWFNPGPGSGYGFVICNLISVGLLSVGAAAVMYSNSLCSYRLLMLLVLLVILGISYAVLYLGIGKALIAISRRFATITALSSLLIHAIVLMAATGIPMAIQLSSRSLRNRDYGPLQWSNPFWAMRDFFQDGQISSERLMNVLVIAVLAFCMVLIHIPSMAREISIKRVALPERLQEDDEQQLATEIGPQSPWDE